jgi:hypothetical protein
VTYGPTSTAPCPCFTPSLPCTSTYRHPQDAVEKRVAMTRLGIPGLVQRLVMLPAVRRDEQSVVRAYRELAEGRREPKEPSCLARALCVH